MRRSRLWLGGLALLVVVAFVAVSALLGNEPGTPPDRRPGPPGEGPLTIVSLGDSTLSGEGAGNYTPDTNGLNGNWCHRSPNALVNQVNVPGVTARVNLACSGAPSEQVALGEVKQYTEPSQAGRLANLVRDHRVAVVVIALGANDDPKFSALVNQCFQAWFSSRAAPCSERIRQDWQAKVDAMVPKVTKAVGDVQRVLEDAGYRDEDYQLVLQSYAAPIGPGIPESLRNLNGCPFRTEDLQWVSGDGIAALNAGVRTAAQRTGARFLDLSRAGVGHEACSGGADPSTEWFSRLSLVWSDLSTADRAGHALQESFHPNAAGHAQFARCLSEFLGTNDKAAACLAGTDGNLHAATSNPVG